MSSEPALRILEVQQTISKFFMHLDRREFRDLANLMTETGIFERLGQKLIGPAGTLSELEKRPLGRTTLHMVTNTVVDLKDDNTADATFYMMALLHEGTSKPTGHVPMDLPFTAQIWTASLTPTKSGWRVMHMRGDPIFQR